MQLPHTTGLFIPFKKNRLLTTEEAKNRFLQGRSRRCPGSIAVYEFDTVIRMNKSFMDVIDKYYVSKGIISGITVCVSLFFIFLLICLFWSALFSPEYKGGVSGVVNAIVFFIALEIMCFYPTSKECFRKTHYPVRFNRKEQLVYVYQVNGEVITLPWNNIYFTTNKQKISYCIVGHILAEDNETVLNTFSFGHVGSRQELALYWEFIRCYMEEDCVEELAEIIHYCPPVEHKKEDYITGLQTLMKVDSRLEFFFMLPLLPLALIDSVGRYIAMQTSKIPQWPQEVLDACQSDSADVIDVSAAINSPHQWRRVLANESEAEIKEVNRRLKSASRRIREKLDARYGQV